LMWKASECRELLRKEGPTQYTNLQKEKLRGIGISNTDYQEEGVVCDRFDDLLWTEYKESREPGYWINERVSGAQKAAVITGRNIKLDVGGSYGLAL